MGWSLRVVGGKNLTFYALAFWQVSYAANSFFYIDKLTICAVLQWS